MTVTNPETARTVIRKARGSLARYRFMAIFTGCMLLALCVEMGIKYLLHADDVVRYIVWIPFAHGWIYVVYLVTVLDLWNKMRWSWKRLIAMVLAGVVPVMSFIVEHKLHNEADNQLTLLERQYANAGSADGEGDTAGETAGEPAGQDLLESDLNSGYGSGTSA